MFGRKRIFHQVFQLVAHLGNVQADDDLNPVAAAYYPVCFHTYRKNGNDN